MWIVFLLIALAFSWINVGIIESDLRYKKIPNKSLVYLLMLLSFFYTYLYFSGTGFSIGLNVLYIFLALIISFVLYYFGIWSAGDAKYLLVLALYLPNIGIIPFLGNIGILTIIYLIFYCLYFYGKLLLDFGHAKRIARAVYVDQTGKWETVLKRSDGSRATTKEIFYQIAKQVLLFLVFFITMRLARMDIVEGLMKSHFLGINWNKMGSYFVFGAGFSVFFLMYFYRFLVGFLRGIFVKMVGLKLKTVFPEETWRLLGVITMLIILLFVVIFDYLQNGAMVFQRLWQIVTYFLAISLLFRLLFYGYKITFHISEQKVVDVSQLKTGDIVDKTHLVKTLGNDMQEIDNPIDTETRDLIIQAFQEYHEEKAEEVPGYVPMNQVKILNTFAFGGYIILGFIVTFTFGDSIIIGILKMVIKYFPHLR